MQIVKHYQQFPDGRPQLGDGVLGGHGVIERGGVEHPGPVAHGTGVAGDGPGVLKEAPGTTRSPQAVALAGEDRGMEGFGPGAQAGSRLPAQVHLQPVTGLPVREAFEGLQDHGRGQHPGRHGGAAPGRGAVQVGEVVVGEDAGAFVGQETVDRALPQTVAQQLPR